MTIFFLSCAAFLAGFVDAVVGGGGLIQLPALFVFLPPSIPPSFVMGTNKLAAMAGTAMAVTRYTRRVEVNWASIVPATLAAFIAAFLGARLVHLLDPKLFKPIVLALLVTVTAYTFFRKNFGTEHAPKLTPSRERLIAVLCGGALGFYDGFFGPGTGSFLIFAFVTLFGFDFLSASASAKVVNLATNLAAFIFFAASGTILPEIAIPMAICNVAGAFLGTRLALQRGAAFVRVLFLFVASALILRFAYELFVQ